MGREAELSDHSMSLIPSEGEGGAQKKLHRALSCCLEEMGKAIRESLVKTDHQKSLIYYSQGAQVLARS
jgi:hypothetical protein